MRRVSWKTLASLSIAVMAIMLVVPTAAVAHASPAATAAPAGPVSHSATPRAAGAPAKPGPSAGFTATPAFNAGTPIPATTTDGFLLGWSVTYTNVNFSVNLKSFESPTNTTFTFIMLNGTSAGTATAIVTDSVSPSLVTFSQTSGISWVGTYFTMISGAFAVSQGHALTPFDKYFFELETTAFTATPINSTGTTGVVGPGTTVPAIAASITNVTAPTGTVTVPFTVNYTITSNANITPTPSAAGAPPATVSVQATLSWHNPVNSTWEQVASLSVAGEVAAAGPGTSVQSFTVDYPFLTSSNFNLSVIPSGAYFINVAFQAWNGWAAQAGAGGAGLYSAPTNASNYVTLTTIQVTTTITTAMPTFQPLPFTVNWTVATSGVTGTPAVLQNVSVTDSTAGVLAAWFTPAYVASSTTQSLTLTAASICMVGNYNGCNTSAYLLPATDVFVVSVTAEVTSGTSVRAATSQVHGFFVAVPMSGTTSAKQLAYGGVAGGLGNVTIKAAYNGSSITSASIVVLTSSGATALKASVLQTVVGPKSASVIWVPTAPGNYTIQLEMNNSAGQTFVSAAQTFTVIQTGGAVVTKNYWNNATLIPGLSTGASAALLLVVGLIIGLIVALLLGRMMWARPKTEPAQPWQAQAGTHECSVCHQTFASDEELAEHSKTAHGIT